MRVVVTKRVEKNLAAAAKWRRDNEGMPSTLPRELEMLGKQLAATPYIGAPVAGARRPDVRRIRLGDSYLLYYRVREQQGEVVLLRAWHASRRPPRL